MNMQNLNQLRTAALKNKGYQSVGADVAKSEWMKGEREPNEITVKILWAAHPLMRDGYLERWKTLAALNI